MGNRAFLAVCGLLLLAAGGLGLAAGLGAFGPGWADRRLVTGAMSHWVARRGWFWPAVAAVAAVVAGFAAAWTVAQWPPRTLRRLALHDRGQVATRMAVRVATIMIIEDVRSYPGVCRVRARLTGPARSPRVRLHVICDGRTDLGVLARRIHENALYRLRGALERSDIAGVVVLSRARQGRFVP